MGRFIVKHYHYVLALLIAILMVLSFLIGVEEGRATAYTTDVVLSCPDEVLSAFRMELGGASDEKSALGALIEGETLVATPPPTPAVLPESTIAVQGRYLGSKNGTKYYTPGCAGAKRIKPENYIWFSDEEDAKLQGYTPANC